MSMAWPRRTGSVHFGRLTPQSNPLVLAACSPLTQSNRAYASYPQAFYNCRERYSLLNLH